MFECQLACLQLLWKQWKVSTLIVIILHDFIYKQNLKLFNKRNFHFADTVFMEKVIKKSDNLQLTTNYLFLLTFILCIFCLLRQGYTMQFKLAS